MQSQRNQDVVVTETNSHGDETTATLVTRKNVWTLGAAWAEPILWYARAIADLKKRPITDPTSWRFYAAIHGISEKQWQELGHLASGETLPDAATQATFWKQCQHGSWFFFPWHRGYLYSLERTLQATIKKLGGPSDWGIPYWNYFGKGENGLPVEFTSPDWPDGKGDNPLYTTQRYGPEEEGGPVYVPMKLINLDALSAPIFTGTTDGGQTGFGGLDTGFSHNGSTHGQLESNPHDQVHIAVGGVLPVDKQTSLVSTGLMGDTDTAAIDPIFYLHHANIDRLWQVWLDANPEHKNPNDNSWINGPSGNRKFTMPMPEGKPWVFSPAGVLDTKDLDYQYEPTPATDLLLVSKLKSGIDLPAAKAKFPSKPHLVGATQQAIAVVGSGVHDSIQLDASSIRSRRGLLSEPGTVPATERVFLNLENITSNWGAMTIEVYLGLTADQDPSNHPENYAGAISLFGIKQASDVKEKHGGNGLTFVLDVTDVVAGLSKQRSYPDAELLVRLHPTNPVPRDAKLKVGRLSIYHQSI